MNQPPLDVTEPIRTGGKMRTLSLVVALFMLVLPACSGGQQQSNTPKAQPSTSSPLYAAVYPTRLTATTMRWDNGMTATNTTLDEAPYYPDSLTEPDWDMAGEIYRKAAADGKDQAMTEKLEESRVISTFVEMRGADMARKVGRNVDQALEASGAKGGTFESRDAVRSGLKSASTEMLEEDTRAYSTAHSDIELNEEQLGRKNRKTLQKQTDSLIAASYFVNIEGPQLLAEMKRIAAESKDIRATMKKEIDAQQAFLDSDATAEQKKIVKARKTSLEEASVQLDTVEQDVTLRLKDADKALKDVQDRYKHVIDEMNKEMDKRAKELAATAKAK